MRPHQYFPAQTTASFTLVIIHGMQEHGRRYQAFAEYLSRQGGNIISFDLPGHGVEKPKDALGDFGTEGLATSLTAIDEFFQRYAQGLPKVLFGHSMGSTLALRYAQQHDLDLLILCGVPVNPVWVLELGYRAAKLEQRLRPQQASVFSNIFKWYNRRFQPCTTASDWLSANPDNVQAYLDDPLCGYALSPSYYLEMFGLMRHALAAKELAKLDSQLKILVIWGADDPVTDFGKGTRHLVNKLQALNYSVASQEYAGLRHEILNEVEPLPIYADVLHFIKANLESSVIRHALVS